MSLMFQTLNELQDVEQVASVFSHGKTPEELKPTGSEDPLFVILVGAPGVGKTSQAKKILAQRGKPYDNFYQVSLDSLVERIAPYRKGTKTLYNEFTNHGTDELTDADLAMLSEVYLATIMSKVSGFDLDYTVQRIMKKKRGNEDKIKKVPSKAAPLKTLVDMRLEGLEYGIEQGFNILYDTTFTAKKNIMSTTILPLLEQYPEHHYHVYVILVTAPKEQIRTQLNKRHRNMIKNEYIRAIPPMLIRRFMIDNEQGFEAAHDYFSSGEYKSNVKNSTYNSSRFTFESVDNPFTPIANSFANAIKKNNSGNVSKNITNQLANLSIKNNSNRRVTKNNSNRRNTNNTRKNST